MISTRLHGILDYALSTFLLFAPQVFGFADEPIARATMMAAGVFGLSYTLFTAHELGLIKLIPMPLHVGLDIGSGLFLLAAPWAFGFAEQVMLPHVSLGLLAISVAVGTAFAPAPRRVAVWIGK